MRLHHAKRLASDHGKRLGSAVLAVVGLLCLVSCNSGSTGGSGATTSPASPATTTTAAQAGCADVAALKSSLEALTKVKPLQDGLTALNGAIADVKTNLDAAEAAATADLQPDVAQVKSAFAAVQTAADDVTTDNLKEKAPSIVAALQELGTATTSLATTLKERCPDS